MGNYVKFVDMYQFYVYGLPLEHTTSLRVSMIATSLTKAITQLLDLEKSRCLFTIHNNNNIFLLAATTMT